MRRLLAMFLCLVICFGLCACSNAESELQKGIWCHEFSALGLNALQEFKFEDSGKFVCMFYINGSFSDMDIGTYQMEKDQIVLTYESGEEATIDYTYEAGKLQLKMGDDTMYNRTSKA